MELEQDYKRDRSSGNGTEIAYTVEARYNAPRPVQVGDQIFDNRWSRVNFVASNHGIPPCAPFYRHTLEQGMLGYAAAQALRWWVHAVADAQSHGSTCLETRLVSHRITFSHKVEAVKAHAHIHGEDRSNCMPDWGTKPDGLSR